VLLCSFVSWKCFQVCRYITLDKLLFQICVVVLHFVLSQHEQCFVVYLRNEISPTVNLSITDSFFLWGSQRNPLIDVETIFVSVVALMLYTLSLLTRFIPEKPMAVTQLPFSMNRWMRFFRTANNNICLFYKSPQRCLLSCLFCFRRYFQKSGHNPRNKVLHNLQLVNFVMKFFSNQSFWCVCKFFSVTSTGCRSDHYRIFRKLCLQKATLKV